MSALPLFVGVDVSKANLDVATSRNIEFSVTNDDAGIAELLKALQAEPCTLIILEATGGFEAPAAVALAPARLPVVVVNPRQTRDFTRVTGRLAKTDSIDARAWRCSQSACGLR
jgi:transposase